MSETAIIIGGGVVGLSAGLALARDGRAVTVIEGDGQRRAASWRNAGHIAIEQVEPLASWAAIRSAPGRLFARGGALAFPPDQWRVWAPFAWRMMRAAHPWRFGRGKAALSTLLGEAMPAWRRLAAGLAQGDLLREDGHIVCWTTEAAARAGEVAWRAADTGTARLRDLNAEERDMLVSLLGTEPAGGLRFENTGQISDLARLADALEAALAGAGGSIVRGHARLEQLGDRVGVTIDGGLAHVPDHVVVAAGVRAGALLSPLGYRVPIIAERGYHIRSRDHGWPAGMPPLVFEDRSMIVTHYAQCVQAASFVEFGDPDAPADPSKWARLERHIAELGLPLRAPFERWMGERPTLPDYLPAIGRSARTANLIYAFGHQHLGLTLAPITGEIVAALVAGNVAPVDLAPFDLERFA